MSLLNITADGLPNVLAVLHATVLRSRRQLSKEDLLEAAAPTVYVSDGADMARQTLNSWIEIGLFKEQDGVVLTDEYPGSATTASPVDLVAFTRKRACSAAMTDHANPDLWGSKGASDLVRALAWWMTQDVYRASFARLAALESEQLVDPERLLFRNATRTSGMQFWAPLLGFSRDRFGASDPTGALRAALPEVLGPGERLTADEFLDRVAKALPVLDRGRWQKEVIENMDPPPSYLKTANQVSSALSRALLNLRATGELQLQRSSDTGSSMVLTGSQGVRQDLNFQQVVRPHGDKQ